MHMIEPGNIGHNKKAYIRYAISEFDMDSTAYRIIEESGGVVSPATKNAHFEYMEKWTDNLSIHAEVDSVSKPIKEVPFANRWRTHPHFENRIYSLRDIWDRF